MSRVYRLDAGRLGKAQRTPQGGLRLPATVAFSTITSYRQPDGTIRREWLPPEEAKKKAFLDSLDMAEVTHGHPPDRVTPANRRHYSVGHAIAGTSRFDESQSGIVAELAIQDENEIASIERGDSDECSLGYDCELERTPGVTPDGREYDAIKRSVIVNHVGLRERMWARSRDASGKGAHLHTDGERVMRLDGNDNVIVPREGRSRSARMFTFDGKQFDLTDAGDVARLEAARDAVAAREAAQATELAAAKTAQGETQAKLDGVTAELTAEKTARGELQARVDGLEVADTVALAVGIAPAKSEKTPSGVDYSKAKSAAEVKLLALAGDPTKAYKVDGRDLAKGEDRAYVEAAFDLRIAAKPAARQDGIVRLRQAGAPVPPTTEPAKTETETEQRTDGRSAYERNRDRLHNRWKTARGTTAAREEG